MGVSHPSLREALGTLSTMKVVENHPGSGTYITSLRPELFINHPDFIFTVNDATFLDLCKARKIVAVLDLSPNTLGRRPESCRTHRRKTS